MVSQTHELPDKTTPRYSLLLLLGSTYSCYNSVGEYGGRIERTITPPLVV